MIALAIVARPLVVSFELRPLPLSKSIAKLIFLCLRTELQPTWANYKVVKIEAPGIIYTSAWNSQAISVAYGIDKIAVTI